MVYLVAAGAWILDRLWGEKASARRYARKWRRVMSRGEAGW